MAKHSGLGKGLDALIPIPHSEASGDGIQQIPVDHIQPNPRQPRVDFNQQELEDLSASIRENGIIQPLLLTPGTSGGSYIVVAGERRLRAAVMAGYMDVPAIIRPVSDEQLLEIALIENLQRADLQPLETAEAYRQLVDDFHLTHEEVALKVGKSRTAVTNSLRLLKLPEDAKKALDHGEISEGHARALLSLPTSAAILNALHLVISRDLNVRQTEALIQRLSGTRPSKSPQPDFHSELRALEDRLRDALGTRVNLKRSAKGGSITIHYYSDEELDQLIGKILH